MAIDFPSSPSEGDRYTENGMVFYYSRGAWRKVMPSKMAVLNYGMDNDGSALNTGIQGTVDVPYGFDIIRWTMIADQPEEDDYYKDVTIASKANTTQKITSSNPITKTTGSFTPNNNTLLVVIASARMDDNTGLGESGWSIDDSESLTWTKQHFVRTTGASLRSFAMIIWTAPVTTGTSMTVTVAHDSNADSQTYEIIDVLEATNADTVNTVGATASDTTYNDGSFSTSLSASPSANSAVIACRYHENNDVTSATPATGWTEIYDYGFSPDFNGLQVQYRLNSTSTTVGWDDLFDAGSGVVDNGFAALAIEIKSGAESSSQNNSCNVDLWSCEYGTVPTAANSMTGNVYMSISGAMANQSGDISNWQMKRINAGNVLSYYIQSCNTISRLTVNIFGAET